MSKFWVGMITLIIWILHMVLRLGDTAPYTRVRVLRREVDNGVVEEGVAMHNTDNQKFS